MADRVICIIPARGGSKGLPGKNIKPLGGKPLIGYSIEAAITSGVCDDVVVTTDDDAIAEVARSFGALTPFKRPEHLSGDAALTEPTLQHALETTEAVLGVKYGIFVFLQPTDIFRSPKWISRAVDALRADPTLESAFVAHESKKNYWLRTPDGSGWTRVMPEMATYMSRQRPHRRLLYREDTGLACASRTEVLRAGKRVGDRVEIIVNDDVRSDIDIHTEFDHWLAEQVFLKWGLPD